MDDADARAEQIIIDVKRGKAVPGSHFMHGPVFLPVDAKEAIATALREAEERGRREGMREAAGIARRRAKRYRENDLYPAYCLNGMAQEADGIAEAIDRAAWERNTLARSSRHMRE